jgi:RNA-directed DNA polymerase
LSLPTVSTKLQWIAETAACEPARVFTTLAHLIDIDFLTEAFHRTRKDSAPGVDGVTADEYAENLDDNLSRLHERLRTGRYHAPPVKRAWLDKDDGGQRPIGMPVFEDKIAQRAVAMSRTLKASPMHFGKAIASTRHSLNSDRSAGRLALPGS